jgi:hypothetical protein
VLFEHICPLSLIQMCILIKSEWFIAVFVYGRTWDIYTYMHKMCARSRLRVGTLAGKPFVHENNEIPKFVFLFFYGSSVIHATYIRAALLPGSRQAGHFCLGIFSRRRMTAASLQLMLQPGGETWPKMLAPRAPFGVLSPVWCCCQG